MSTFWILASNSWMHTPSGYEIVDGRIVPVDWLAVIFNPSFPFRWAHMTIAAYLSVAFLVGASAAWHLLRGNDNPAVRKMFSMAMWMALLVAPIQAFVGDAHGLNTLEHQPAKIAAMEGHWENPPGEATPLILFGWPDMEREETRFKLEIPVLGSLILKHSLTEPIPALKDFPKEDRPPAYVVFWSFRIMVALGMLMIAAGLWSAWLRWRGKLFETRGFLRLVDLHGAGRPHRPAGRLVHHRGGPPAVDRLRPPAHQGRGVQPQRHPAEHHPGGLRGGLLRRVRHRHPLCAAHDRQGSAHR